MHWVTRVKPPTGFEPGSPGLEADDLPSYPSPLQLNVNNTCNYHPQFIASNASVNASQQVTPI